MPVRKWASEPFLPSYPTHYSPGYFNFGLHLHQLNSSTNSYEHTDEWPSALCTKNLKIHSHHLCFLLRNHHTKLVQTISNPPYIAKPKGSILDDELSEEHFVAASIPPNLGMKWM